MLNSYLLLYTNYWKTRENADIILPQKENIDTALLFVSQHLQDILAEMDKTSSSNTVKYDPQHETYMKLAHEMVSSVSYILTTKSPKFRPVLRYPTEKSR